MKLSKIKITLSLIIAFLVISLSPNVTIQAKAAEGLPAFDGSKPYFVVNNNIPAFSDTDLIRTDAFEIYSDLDAFGRCGVAYANICKELMPTTERG